MMSGFYTIGTINFCSYALSFDAKLMNIALKSNEIAHIKIVTSFHRAALSYSAVQPPFDI